MGVVVHHAAVGRVLGADDIALGEQHGVLERLPAEVGGDPVIGIDGEGSGGFVVVGLQSDLHLRRVAQLIGNDARPVARTGLQIAVDVGRAVDHRRGVAEGLAQQVEDGIARRGLKIQRDLTARIGEEARVDADRH